MGTGRSISSRHWTPDRPDRFLKFDTIPAVAYRYIPRERTPAKSGTYRLPEVYLSYDLVGGNLEFRVLAYTGLASRSTLARWRPSIPGVSRGRSVWPAHASG